MKFMEMKAGNRIFVDTNILLSATDKDRPNHAASLTFLEQGLSGELSLYVCGQVIREYLVVATRSIENNGLELSPTEADDNVRSLMEAVQILDENRESLGMLRSLIRTKDLKGKRIHDANIVAVMLAHGLNRLRTLNAGDFDAFKDECVLEAGSE